MMAKKFKKYLVAFMVVSQLMGVMSISAMAKENDRVHENGFSGSPFIEQLKGDKCDKDDKDGKDDKCDKDDKDDKDGKCDKDDKDDKDDKCDKHNKDDKHGKHDKCDEDDEDDEDGEDGEDDEDDEDDEDEEDASKNPQNPSKSEGPQGGSKQESKKQAEELVIKEELIPLSVLTAESVEAAEPAAEETAEITEEVVPLAAVPKTGDASALWMALTILSGSGLMGFGILAKKRKENDAE